MKWLILCLSLFTLTVTAQDDFSENKKSEPKNSLIDTVKAPIPFRLGVKAVPLSMLDPSLASIQGGVEYVLGGRHSLNLDLAFRPKIKMTTFISRENPWGIKARLQHRYYVLHRLFRGIFFGSELFYKYQEFGVPVLIGHGCTGENFEANCDYYEDGTTQVNQHTGAAGLVFGFNMIKKERSDNRWFVDISTSLGMRVIYEVYEDFEDDINIFSTNGAARSFNTPWLAYPNIGFTFRVGYWIL